MSVHFGPNVASDLLPMMQHPDQWAEARDAMSVFQLYVQCVLANLPNEMGVGPNSHGALVGMDLFRRLADWGIPLALEGGAVKAWSPDGHAALHGWQTAVDRVRAAGGEVAAVVLDEPLGASVGTIEDTVAGTAVVIDGLRAMGVWQVGLVEPYPACAAAAIIDFMERVQQAGSSPSFLHLDVDRYAIRDQKLKDAQVSRDLRWLYRQCEAWGIPCGAIIFGQRADTDAKYAQDALTLLAELKHYFGRWPQHLVVQSWETPYAPTHHTQPMNLPETAAHSHTALVNTVARVSGP